MNELHWPKEFTIKILGNFWAVRVVNHPIEVDGCAVWGYKDSEEGEIVLSVKGNVVATFIHEVQHVFAEILRIPDDTSEADAMIERISQLVMAFLVDNPQLMRSLLAHIEADANKNKKYKGPRTKKAAKRKRGRPPKDT